MRDNSPVYWRMRNGNLINVDDMDNNHVRNAFKMLLRNLQKLAEQKNSKPVNKCEICNYEKGHHNMCPNNIINSDSYSYREQQFTLNGDMAQQFHESYLSDEDDDRMDL